MTRSAWLISFADLAAVLAAFFVLLLAMSDFDAPALDRLALVFGKSEGEWQAVTAATAITAPRVSRSDDAEAETLTYQSRIVTEKLNRTDWPWLATRLGNAVGMKQIVPPDGPVLPAEMAGWLRSTGYPLRIVAVVGAPDNGRSPSRGLYDTGLQAAADLSAVLQRNGLTGAVPLSTRAEANGPALTLYITFDPRTEIR